jgi:hypothetical protein
MLKKCLIVGGCVALLGAVTVGRDAYSYLRTAAGYLSGAVRESVPVEFQVDRARGMIQDLLPEVRKNMHLIAKEEVQLAELERQITDLAARLEKEKADILRLKDDLAQGRDTYTYADRQYTADEVRADLAARFQRYKTNEATLASLREIRQSRHKGLLAARQKLEGMLASKRQLQVEVENLDARAQMIAAAKTAGSCQFDDSRLGRVKELVGDLRCRLDVAEKLVAADIQYHDEIPLDRPSTENILDEIGKHFNVAVPAAESAADKVAKQ